jgi:ribonuclease-3
MPAELPDLAVLEARIAVQFNDRQLLQQAFVHRSYLNEHRSFPLGHNERLEFLGDAVLELVVTENLYLNFPNPEGELTNWRSSLVKGEMLAKIAISLDYSEFLLLSFGEARSGGKSKNQLLANAFEAVLGALYLDQGYAPCKEFITRTVIVHLPEILENKLFIDPKSRLQELTQERFGITPEYRMLGETGPDHAKDFVAAVCIKERELGQGSGNSKQAAQVAAAQAALEKLLPD